MLTDKQLKALMDWIDARIAHTLGNNPSLFIHGDMSADREQLFAAFYFVADEEGNPVVGSVCKTCGREMPCDVCGEPDKWAVTVHPKRAYGFAVINETTGAFWMNASGQQARFWSNQRDAQRSARRLNDGTPL